MFNFIIKRNKPVITDILKRHVVKRQINNNSTSILSRNKNNENSNLESKFRLKHNRKYSVLPEPINNEDIKLTKFYFIPHENLFAHSVLESKEIYSNNIVKNFPVYDDEVTKEEVDNYIHQSWKSVEVPKIIEAFKRISYYASKNEETITDQKYNKFVKYLIANCQQFTDTEMSDVLKSIALWPTYLSRHDEGFRAFYTALDKECVRRAHQWSFDELLLFADHWHTIKLLRHTEFGVYVIKKMGSKSSRMTPSNLVQYMFYVSSSQKYPGDMYNLEYKMETCVDELDLNEIAILAMGFFKSQTPIRNPNLLVKIIQRLIKDIDTINEISLSAFMKIIRYSLTVQRESGILWELLLSTIPQIPRLSLQALIHIITMAVKTRICQPELLTLVAARFNKEIKDARVKDMERLVLALTSFNFTPDIEPNIFQTIVEELSTERRVPELERYPKSVSKLLQYLNVANIYPKNLIALILNPENIKQTYGPSPYNLDDSIYILDLNVDVDVPDYTGPRLSNRAREVLAKGYVNKNSASIDRQLSARHTFLYEVMETLKKIFRSPETIHLDWVLPQYKEADLIICLDENNTPLKVANVLSEIKLGNVKRRPEGFPEDSRWIALVIGSINCYARDSRNLLGKDSIKVRQLEKIGYQPIVIPWYEWHSTGLDRKDYLKRKLFK